MKRSSVLRLAALPALLVLAMVACWPEPETVGGSRPRPPLDVGKAAPDFTLSSSSGQTMGLEDFTGTRPALFYFSMGPGWTPCIEQIVDLQQDREFGELDVELVSVSPDEPESWHQVASDYEIDSVLLSDPANEVADRYGVMSWRVPQTADVDSAEPGHTFVLVDEDGTVSWVRDYGAPENGGLMYVSPQELVPEVGRFVDS